MGNRLSSFDDLTSFSRSGTVVANAPWVASPDFPFSQIATGDLDVAIIGQLPAPNLAFRNHFEPRPMEVVGFEAAFSGRGLRKQDLENARGNPHHAFIVAHPDPEFDGVPVEVPPGVRWEAEENGVLIRVLLMF
jgi:hypothetical protein